MEENVFHQIELRVKQIEKEYGSLENFVISTTNLNEEHRMRMEEQYFSIYKELAQVYQELNALELADLVDFQEFVGRFDGEFS